MICAFQRFQSDVGPFLGFQCRFRKPKAASLWLGPASVPRQQSAVGPWTKSFQPHPVPQRWWFCSAFSKILFAGDVGKSRCQFSGWETLWRKHAFEAEIDLADLGSDSDRVLCTRLFGPRSWACTSNLASTSISQLGRLREQSMHWWTTLSWFQAGHHSVVDYQPIPAIYLVRVEMGMGWKDCTGQNHPKPITPQKYSNIQLNSVLLFTGYRVLTMFWPTAKLSEQIDRWCWWHCWYQHHCLRACLRHHWWSCQEGPQDQTVARPFRNTYLVSLAGATSKRVLVPLYFQDTLAITFTKFAITFTNLSNLSIYLPVYLSTYHYLSIYLSI